MKVAITGISGTIGRSVASRLVERGHEVLGIDRRPWFGAPEGIKVHQVDIRKRPAEDVFRTELPSAVVHMATVTHLSARNPDQMRINLQGTRAVFDYAHRYEVSKVVFVGRHTYYGAAPDAPLYHAEDEPPMAVHTFPELADLVAADLYAGSALWRYPEMHTAVLRFCYTLGPSRHGTLAAFLGGPRTPTVLGFDPLFQFMHESDVADAIAMGLEVPLRGVYNVAGPQPLPLSVIVRESRRRNLAIPELLMPLALGRFGLPKLPTGAIEHLKYPVVIDSSLFRSVTGFVHRHTERETIDAFAARSSSTT
ncbi:MAG: NAD-dependent epimerase/dehydratase family protein [Myxococcota bacterium]